MLAPATGSIVMTGHCSRVITTPGGGVPTILVVDGVAEHPVVVEQVKSQPGPAIQAVEQTRAVSELQSSSSFERLPDPPPPLKTPPKRGAEQTGAVAEVRTGMAGAGAAGAGCG